MTQDSYKEFYYLHEELESAIGEYSVYLGKKKTISEYETANTKRRLFTAFSKLYNSDLSLVHYWSFAPFSCFVSIIPNLKKEYFNKFIDAQELDFWENQLRIHKNRLTEKKICYTFPYGTKYTVQIDLSIFSPQLIQKIEYSENRKIEYILNQIELINSHAVQMRTVKWLGNNVEVVELIKSLIESKKIDRGLTEKEIFDRFSDFFEYEINLKKGKDNIRTRFKGGGVSKFLNYLSDTIIQWNKEMDSKTR